MVKKNLYKPIEVEYKLVEECPLTKSNYTFFQILYVISGEGFAIINDHKTTYRPGNLLLFVPNDHHTLDVPKPSEFLLIKFNRNYLNTTKTPENINSLIHYAPDLQGCILQNEDDKLMVKNICSLIVSELKNGTYNHNEPIVMHFLNALIFITTRSIITNQHVLLTQNSEVRIQKIISYVQEHIHFPQKIKAEIISEKFGLSKNYLSHYFKNQTGETISRFIMQHRLKLIEHRLIFSDIRVNEIVDEFGFADESHLNKFFKKHKGVSLTEFRKKQNKLA
ncbi:helix-turn-helix domain-containing protein [Chryseobacterium vrystaatense]|uniref:HTH araC/xylS-type domain-containing protein n=1 Tax=Chryseobacterium vrystaatense TaxID=307480 RepID=A0ABR4USD4_9FLAO|nr:AraC family transcriptional regulator [Chryseobacterium vrystaatense]KFF28189.1 hypothetical protein IW16_02950 [Chryseobacterium vrystaatense]